MVSGKMKNLMDLGSYFLKMVATILEHLLMGLHMAMVDLFLREVAIMKDK